jgi:molybdopterin synthase catalytic subunit
MNQISVLFFATLKDLAGTNRALVELPDGARVGDLKDVLAVEFPNLKKGLPSSLVALNQEFAFDEDIIPSGAEVAMFPPVSGGNELPTIVRVTREALDLDELVGSITLPTTGAACLFTGVVRGETLRGDAHSTVRLEYEAYVPMAEAKMRQVVSEIRARWHAVEGIAIIQRIGELLPGTPTVLIACSAAHRDTGVFEAARYGIDRLKEIVPVWKKEVGAAGEEWVEGEYIPTRED